MSGYKAVDEVLGQIEGALKDARWALHDDAFREVLRGVRGIVFEQELKLGSVRIAGDDGGGLDGAAENRP